MGLERNLVPRKKLQESTRMIPAKIPNNSREGAELTFPYNQIDDHCNYHGTFIQ